MIFFNALFHLSKLNHQWIKTTEFNAQLLPLNVKTLTQKKGTAKIRIQKFVEGKN